MPSIDLNHNQIIQLAQPKEFDLAFYRLIAQGFTHEEAYEELEDQYRRVFNQRRYANFESYRVARHRRVMSASKNSTK